MIHEYEKQVLYILHQKKPECACNLTCQSLAFFFFLHMYSYLCKSVCVYLCLSGCSMCHASDLHHSLCLFPESLQWALVSDEEAYANTYSHCWSFCYDHRFDYDGTVSSGLFTWSGDVLLHRLELFCFTNYDSS